MKKMLSISAFLAIVVGFILIVGALSAIVFTYQNVARENIITPADAAIPGAPVRGPFTLKAQSDIIRTHVLRSTGGQTFAEMPRQIPQLNAAGQPILGADGQPVMIANAARDLWITATTLITALHLAMLTYGFSGLILLFGLVSVWTGFTFLSLRRGLTARA